MSSSISRIFAPPLPMMRPVWPAHSTSTARAPPEVPRRIPARLDVGASGGRARDVLGAVVVRVGRAEILARHAHEAPREFGIVERRRGARAPRRRRA